MTITRLLALLAVLAVAAVMAGCGGARKKAPASERVYLHTVVPGEALEDIAEEYYGDPRRADVIAAFNKTERSQVTPGKVLRVPMSSEDVGHLQARERARTPYNRGIELAASGSYVDAVQEFKDALSIDPAFTDAAYNLGVTYNKLKAYDRASDVLEDIAKRRPNRARYRFALGNSYFHLEHYDRAVDAFETVLRLEPSNTKAQFSLAMSYEKLGHRDKAKEAWKHYLQLDSSSVWAAEARKHLENLK